MPEEIYVFTERTYQRLTEAKVSPLSVTDVLYGRQLVRRHISASLQVAGRDRSGVWLAVARYLDDAEIQAIGRMRGMRDE